MAMKRIELPALPRGLSGMHGHLFFAALSNMLKWNHRTNALEKHRFGPVLPFSLWPISAV
ncbi:hypothetical protein ACGYKB_11055 [Sulfitobacter sp. 916]|uniref:hypothetical protein n=1 Tax=Sulfitobacter sp. 916 TaxID=3368559 RepID=UPI00374554B7